MKSLAYVDASALVKLVIDEPDSLAMNRWYVEAERLITSRVGHVETVRAASRRGHDPVRRDRVLAGVEVYELDAGVAGVAAGLQPVLLRTLDAIHIATALALGPELNAFVTYDERMAEVARAVGLPVVRPA
jgi:predicted nucleic acid-binding protein